MIEMNVEDVVVRVAPDDPSHVVAEQRIVLLRERDGERRLPIWVGPADGNALAVRLTDEPPPRPLTSDLMVDLLRVTGAHVERVAVVSLRDNTFYATIVVDGQELDARPSDAINLAVRIGAPIVVDESVLGEAGGTREEVERRFESETAKVGHGLPAGRWMSLSAELLRSLHQPPK